MDPINLNDKQKITVEVLLSYIQAHPETATAVERIIWWVKHEKNI